jgi:hypothetical protein
VLTRRFLLQRPLVKALAWRLHVGV